MVERGIGRGLAAILPTSAGDDETLHRIPLDLIVAQPEPAAQGRSTSRSWASWPTRCASTACCSRSSCDRCPAAATSCVAGERRWRAARLAGLERIPAVVRTRRGERAARARDDREHGAPGPQPGRGRPRLRGARRRVRSDEGGGRPPRRQEPRGDLEPRAPARAARRGARDARGRARCRRATAARCCRRPTTTLAGASRARRATAACRCARPRTSRAVGLRGRLPSAPRSLQSADALAASREAEEALAALLGREVRVRMGRRGGAVEIPFDDLAELSEIARRISGRRPLERLTTIEECPCRRGSTRR